MKLNLPNSLCAIVKMLFDLLVCEFEYLKAFWICCLSGLSLSEEIYYSLVWESLLHIAIIEIDNGISIRKCLSPYFI